jgi:hypothetical protein
MERKSEISRRFAGTSSRAIMIIERNPEQSIEFERGSLRERRPELIRE